VGQVACARTAWEAMHTLVEENGYSLRAEQDEIVELMLRIEDKNLGVEKIAEWIRQRAISQFELGTDS